MKKLLKYFLKSNKRTWPSKMMKIVLFLSKQYHANMPETKNKLVVDWARVLNNLALIFCAVSLALIALSLRPLAKWASFQSICIEQESIKAPINWAVRKCNGRSKVYQVK